jgi:hypothetical protein
VLPHRWLLNIVKNLTIFEVSSAGIFRDRQNGRDFRRDVAGFARIRAVWLFGRLTCIAHCVGRTEAETLAGTAQTASSVLTTCILTAPIEEAEVPAIARFAWSGLQIGAQ